MLRERDAYVLGEALTGHAAVVRPGERPLVTDGPFAETKEGVGGFYVIECASRKDALDLAVRVPQSPGVAVEVPRSPSSEPHPAQISAVSTSPVFTVSPSRSPNQRRPMCT